MTDVVIEFTGIAVENMGHLNPGKIKFSDQSVTFKNTKTGKLDQIPVSQIKSCRWIRLGNKPGMKVTEKDGTVHRYGGFTGDLDYEKLKNFTKNNWRVDLLPAEPCVKGWNFGTAEFRGPSLDFEVDNQGCFEIPLSNVSNCTSTKNEAVLEFHQNEDCAVSLMEMRFHLPPEGAEDDASDPVEEFKASVLKYAASVAEEADDRAFVTLEEILCLTPRGRYDIKIFPSHLSLHGTSFDYKIPIKTILRLFLLPHKDGNRMFFVVSLDPPIRQGQTRYHFLVLEFSKDDEVDVELGLTEEQVEEKYSGKLQKEMSGPVYEVLSRIMRALVNQKITVPGGFVGHSGTPAIGCAYKQAAGFLYPLEKGFVYVHKPPMYNRFEDIQCVNFARSDVSTRSFDFEVELKNGTVQTFNSIEKEEYTRLYDFVEKKKLRIRNAGKRLDKVSYKEDDFAGSSDEEELDPYKARLAAEKRNPDPEEGESDSEDVDSDYNPEIEKEKKEAKKKRRPESDATSGSEPNEEFDSDVGESSSGSESPSGSPVKKKKKPEKSKKITKTKKAKKDPTMPKKAQSAYMIWFLANREKLKEPGMSITDVAKKGGAVWRELSDKSKWERKAAEDKERYNREMAEWRRTGGPSKSKQPESKKESKSSKKTSSKSSPAKQAKSKEYVSDSDDSSDSDKAKSSKKPEKDDDEESESTPGSESGSE